VERPLRSVHTLPSFNGLSALKIAPATPPHVPFIFVSGTSGEEVAIEALKIGAGYRLPAI
jgi:hypothetical protein